MKMPKLHTQIVIALILGAVFGSIFNVNPKKLDIIYQEGKDAVHTTIYNWEKLIFVKDSVELASYNSEQQLEILAFAKLLKKEKKNYSLQIENFYYEEKSDLIKNILIQNVKSVQKEQTTATSIKFIGDIFIRLLMMIAIPLILSSLIVGAASLGNINKFARIGGKTIAFYLITTAIAITIGLAVANIIEPGNRMDQGTKDKLLGVYQSDITDKIETAIEYNIINEIVNIVPRNPIDAMSSGNMLQIVFFALMIGIALTLIQKEKSDIVVNFFDGLSDTMIKLVEMIMVIAPFGVFALISATVGEFGFNILQTLLWYSIAVILGLLLHTLITYSIIVKSFSKIKVIQFFKAIRRAHAIAFSTSSSAATLPVTMDVCNNNLGVKKSISSFVLPLGATINMDGTALYQGVAAVFIGQVFGFDLTLGQQLTIVFTAVLASIGTAPVPGVGLIMLVIILKSVGIPEEGVALILGVDRILDMCRTITNITGDAAVTVAVATSENEITEIHLENA